MARKPAMAIKLAALLFIFLLGSGSSHALVIPLPDPNAQTFHDWTVYTEGKFVAAVADTPTGTFQMFQHRGDNGLLGLYCNPESSDTCVWILAAKSKCVEGKSLTLQAKFVTNGYKKSIGKKYEVSCHGAEGDYYYYVFPDSGFKEIVNLILKVEGEETTFLDLSSADASSKIDELHFEVFEANKALPTMWKAQLAARKQYAQGKGAGAGNRKSK